MLERVSQAVRSARTLGALLLEIGLDPAADSATESGLERIRPVLARRLRELGVEVEIIGTERVPTTGGLVFMWNQTSHLDHLVVPLAIPRPFLSTYNNELRRFPIYGKRLQRSEHFWLDRTDEAQWRTQIAKAARRVAGGECVIISPEGTRSRDGRLLPMKRGAFLLARLAGQPIVCVTVRGAHACLPRGAFIVRPGRVVLEVSHPIPIDARSEPLEQTVVSTFAAALAR